MISVEEAQDRVVAGVSTLPAETVGLTDAAGRVLAGPLTARRTQPPFAASAMDGYAVRAADVAKVPVTLTQVGAVAKRHDAQLNLEPFFLGGLFKSIGTPLVPFAEMPQPKQKLAMKDMYRWAEY